VSHCVSGTSATTDDLLAVLWLHPQGYVDVGIIDCALPEAEFYRYLRTIVEAGVGDRVMFGTDQMVWPETIERAVLPILILPGSVDVAHRPPENSYSFGGSAPIRFFTK